MAQSSPVENTTGKGEIACYEQYLLFPHCFHRLVHKNQGLFGKGLIYNHEFPGWISCTIKMFADDTKLYMYSPITKPGNKDCVQKIYKKLVDGQPNGNILQC